MMRNFEQKKGWKNIMRSKPALIFLGAVVLFFAWSVLGFWNKMKDTGNNEKIAADKVASLEAQKQKYLSDINSLNTDAGKEKFIRENYGLAKDGEDMIVVVDDKNSTEPQKSLSAGFFSFFTNLFK
ncbi:MAG: FtsB family cell division protein [Minisyncoccia bacterium]